MCTVSPYEKIEIDLDFCWSVLDHFTAPILGGILRVVRQFVITDMLEPCGLLVEVGACELVVEMQCGVWKFG